MSYWVFHIVPERSVKWVKESGFLTGYTPEGVCFSLGSQEGIYAETCIEGVYAETCILRKEPYREAFRGLVIVAFRFDDLKRGFPVFPSDIPTTGLGGTTFFPKSRFGSRRDSRFRWTLGNS